MSFSLTRKTDYALLALTRLSQAAAHAGGGQQQIRGAGAVSARTIAGEFALPLPVLTNILKDLNTAGLITSRRGAGGGYFLNRSASQITLVQVVAAIEGPVTLARCCDPRKDDDSCPTCQLTSRCPIMHMMHRFNDAITRAMQQLTLAQMMRDDFRIALNIQPVPMPTNTPRNLSLAQTG